eukprot:235587-Pleurochrysis_carterae.AAC.1
MYTPNEGVRGIKWVHLNTLKLRARACGGIIVVHFVELPGLGKSGGTVESPPLTLALPLAHAK